MRNSEPLIRVMADFCALTRAILRSDVTLTSGKLHMQTPTLRLALPDDLVSVFPKVLRGTKLVPSQRLELYRSEDAFAFARRCLLVVMTPTLLFLGAVLPGVLPDWLLSLSAVALLSVVHIFGRWIEILQLSPALIFGSMILFYGGVLWLCSYAYRRAFSPANGG